MAVVAYLVWARLRRRWRGLLALALLAGLAAGAVIASASGARRTETAYDRMVVATDASSLLVSSFDGGGYERLEAVDGIERVASLTGFELYPVGHYGALDVITRASNDGVYLFEVDRPNLTSGRMPLADRAFEVLVNPTFESTFGLGQGDEVTLALQSSSEYRERTPPGPDTATFDVTITGVGVTTTEVVATSDLDALPGILVTPAMFDLLMANDAPPAFDGVAVRLAEDAVVAVVRQEIERVMGEDAILVLDSAGTQATVERAIRPQATALWAFTAVLALAAILVVGQAVARQAWLGAAEDRAATARPGMPRSTPISARCPSAH